MCLNSTGVNSEYRTHFLVSPRRRPQACTSPSWLHPFLSQHIVGLMVGIFHLGNKSLPVRSTRSTDTVRPNTPPPPYGHERPVYSTATTTTTTRIVTTTTHTTTHFFSLPLWRRRTHHPTPTDAASPEEGEMHPDDLGVLGPPRIPSVLMRDKDLPPTPPSDESREITDEHPSPETRVSPPVHQGTVGSGIVVSPDSTPPPHLQRATQGSRSVESTQGTAALARAALGLGLPPLMFAPTPGPSSQVNSVAFVAHPSPSGSSPKERLSFSSSTMRRAKSFHKDSDAVISTAPVDIRERRRNRGLSLGPLLSGSDDKGKGKEKEVEAKSLSRKSSFWNRKRDDSRPPTPVVPPSPNPQLLQLSPLPALQPMSPFHLDTVGKESASPRLGELDVPQSADLRRRHSERAPSSIHESSPSLDGPSAQVISSQSQRRRRPLRPQTADSGASPRAQSSYFPSNISAPPLTSSPSPFFSPSSSDKSLASSTNGPTRRPRSQTNPPLLRRLSMNLFGTSSPSPSPASTSIVGESYTRSPSTSFSSSRVSVARQSPKVSAEIPRPRYHDEESPEIYLQRLMEAVSKAEVATVLASR